MVGKSEEHAQMICYATPAVPSSRHEGIHNNALGGAGDWILEISEWREWRERESCFFYQERECPGYRTSSMETYTIQKPTRKRLTFVNTTVIAYTKIMRLRPIFCQYARAAVFTNVRRLRVFNGVSDWILKVPVRDCEWGVSPRLVLPDNHLPSQRSSTPAMQAALV